MRMRLTGTSVGLPDSVRGTSLIWRISSGTCSGEQSSRVRRVLIRQARGCSATQPVATRSRTEDRSERHTPLGSTGHREVSESGNVLSAEAGR